MKTTFDVAEALGIDGDNVALVGSRLICGTGNDWDFLVLMNFDEDQLEELGFEPDLSDARYDSNFQSWRKGDVNLIVTDDRGFFLAEYATAIAAMAVQRSWNQLGTRERRVDFHGYVRGFVTDKLGADL